LCNKLLRVQVKPLALQPVYDLRRLALADQRRLDQIVQLLRIQRQGLSLDVCHNIDSYVRALRRV
jgi:hypothetical protein